MDTLLTFIFIVVIPLLILMGLLFLGEYTLKRIIKPNKEYLKEFKNTQLSRLLDFINLIIVMIVIVVQGFDIKSNLWLMLLILVFVVEIIRNKYQLDYLNTKDESNYTRKYVLYHFFFQLIIFTLILGLIYIYNTTV